nr:MAG TPA: hypothetical protein [Caudoviricetes sp.]
MPPRVIYQRVCKYATSSCTSFAITLSLSESVARSFISLI